MTVATGISAHLDGSVAVLRLEGAGRMNAIGSATCQALADAVS